VNICPVFGCLSIFCSHLVIEHVRFAVVIETGSNLEALYEAEGLRDSLGDIDFKIQNEHKQRQDLAGCLATPAPVSKLMAQQAKEQNPYFSSETETLDIEVAYIHYLRLLAVALEPKVAPDVESQIGHLVR